MAVGALVVGRRTSQSSVYHNSVGVAGGGSGGSGSSGGGCVLMKKSSLVVSSRPHVQAVNKSTTRSLSFIDRYVLNVFLMFSFVFVSE